MSDSNLLIFIKDSMQELGTNSLKDLGPLIKHVSSKLVGKASPKQIGEIAKQILNEKK